MICEDMQEELVAYCDGELPEEDRAQIAAHLSTCSACSRDVAQYTRVSTLLTQQSNASRRLQTLRRRSGSGLSRRSIYSLPKKAVSRVGGGNGVSR